ncbi:hypothetical protein SAMN05444161_6843 [Rhizobiales bacterium GAS191]|jgi:hypothetical protein|nr:hypothetical protein SAMN05519103_08966 [Rhizobiales bacterium GAS113]SEE71691.1 hypothetical protein SAMN05444161_6843 [Rhizobiales bacterium GAS191]SEF02577.1 hypothetical protein SAMN05519104_7877 [Rhizobiales bacterium GAS188]
MATHTIDRKAIGQEEDWIGNNAAFTCPVCRGVYVVSGMLHKKGRECPKCHQSKGLVVGGKDSGGSATIEWPLD